MVRNFRKTGTFMSLWYPYEILGLIRKQTLTFCDQLDCTNLVPTLELLRHIEILGLLAFRT